MSKYSIVTNEEDFKSSIKSHFHGDYGCLFTTPSEGGRTIWQCGCGYRSLVNELCNIIIKDTLKISVEVNHP
jgi:hypothetical protein